MTCYIELYRSEVQYRRREVLLAQIFFSARFFNYTGNRRPVIGRNIKLFDGNYKFTLPAKVEEVALNVNSYPLTVIKFLACAVSG